MKEETVKLLMDKLELVATKIGVTAEYMFGVYLKQAQVSAINHGIFFMITSILVGFTIYWFISTTKKDKWGDKDITWQAVVGICTGIVSVIVFIIASSEIGHFTTCIFNPEYYALKELFKSLK